MAFDVIGDPAYQDINHRFLSAIRAKKPLVAVHRGQNSGSIVENTAKAVRAAVVSGADIVEIDVIESTDGDFFTFHNGYEGHYFGLDQDILTLSTGELERLQYETFVSAEAEKCGVEKLATILEASSDTIINIDRSWNYWQRLLPFLDTFQCADRVLLKAPVSIQWLEELASHPVKYPFMPIVKTIEEVDLVLSLGGINTMAIEIVAENDGSELASPDLAKNLHDANLLVQLNALNLPNRVPLFLGWDDEVSVLDEPEKGWGLLVDHGADIIQTDWPMLLNRFLSSRK